MVVEFFEVVVGGCRSFLLLVTTVEKHRTVHIFHNVEILKVRNFIYEVNTCSSLPSQISSSYFLL